MRAEPQTPLYIITPLGARPGLGTQPFYEAPCDLQIKHRQNIVINIKSVAGSSVMAQNWQWGSQTVVKQV